jgi:hypothetical protein
VCCLTATARHKAQEEPLTFKLKSSTKGQKSEKFREKPQLKDQVNRKKASAQKRTGRFADVGSIEETNEQGNE